jgi:hypothetical protein
MDNVTQFGFGAANLPPGHLVLMSPIGTVSRTAGGDRVRVGFGEQFFAVCMLILSSFRESRRRCTTLCPFSRKTRG